MLKTGPCWSLLWGHCSQGIGRKKMKDKENCEDGNRQYNMENVLMGHLFPSRKNVIGYVDSKNHTITHHTKRHVKIRSCESSYHCSLCGKGSISKSHMNSHMKSNVRENLNPGALCGRELISKNHPKRNSKRSTGKKPYHCTLCAKYLSPWTTQIDTEKG